MGHKKPKIAKTTIVSGNGSDITNADFLCRKAKRKLVTSTVILSLIDLAKEQGDKEKEQAYWNTYHCQSKLVSNNGKLYGNYCKNRFCSTCCANRKADLINKYYPIIKEWDEPHFVTLTFKSTKESELKRHINGIKKNFTRVLNRCKKRHQRGKGIKVMGIKSLECNFNPKLKLTTPLSYYSTKQSYSPTIKKEWLIQNRPTDPKAYKYKYVSPKAQDIKKIEDLDHQLVEVIKYGAKIFTEPDVKNKKSGVAPFVYIKALDTIYTAMKGKKLFDSFGFNLPQQNKEEVPAQLLSEFNQWYYDIELNDWIDTETGEILANFTPTVGLEFLLNQQINNSSF